MKRTLPLIFILVFISSVSFSQEHIPVSGYISFAPAVPTGEFKDVTGRTAWGGRLGILLQPQKNLPLKLGVELGYATQGFSTQYFNSINFSQFSDYRVRARLNIFSGLFNLRLQDGSGRHFLNPFVEGLIGWNNFYGSSKLEERNPAKDYNWEKLDRESTKGYWGRTYGGSVGVDIRLHRKENYVSLEVKIAYLKGDQTRYYTNPSVDPNGYAFFTLNQSETDMLIPQIGLKFGL
jgi:hypothetical protein